MTMMMTMKTFKDETNNYNNYLSEEINPTQHPTENKRCDLCNIELPKNTKKTGGLYLCKICKQSKREFNEKPKKEIPFICKILNLINIRQKDGVCV